MQNNLQELTVTELSAALKRTVEDRFGLVRVRGEISGFRGAHSSGHCYFALKDDRARLEAVIWKATYPRVAAKLQEGLEVVATGKLTTFPGSSKYQIVIEAVEPAGVGALMALLEERKRKLAAEGLFAPERKRALPYLPLVIGVVTSPTGAVIRDVLHRIADRFPLHVIVWPVRVQGETSGAEVAAAIRGFNALGGGGKPKRPDLLIVARGGGSIEDLWGFNDEEVVRAAAESDIPLISAVGHETDWTLIDLAADIRAPTPTGAAEMAVPVKADLEAHVATLAARLSSCVRRSLDRARSELRAAQRGLGTPDAILAQPSQRLDAASARLGRALELALSRKRQAFSRTEGRLGRGVIEQRTRFARQSLDRLSRRLTPRIVERTVRLSREASDRAASRALRAHRANLERARARFDQGWRLIENLSHKRVLERGFALVLDSAGKAITSAGVVKDGQALTVQMRDGAFSATAGSGGAKPQAAPKRAKGEPGAGQGSLF